MLIGSGLIAQAFRHLTQIHSGVCVYAAGVSNSLCSDDTEFLRERVRLSDALLEANQLDTFVYFGTCSVTDPDAIYTPYVQHKLAMEKLVSAHPRYLILRLPQVAGVTPNPHTLLNYLFAKIIRSESFALWNNAKRNIIDVKDVVAITEHLISNRSMLNVSLNVANPQNYTMVNIVSVMEQVVGKQAIYHTVERGTDYTIDVSAIAPLLTACSVSFGQGYLERVIGEYYGKQ